MVESARGGEILPRNSHAQALSDQVFLEPTGVEFAIPTIRLNWLQPHEGSIVDFLFRQRAFQFEKDFIKI